MEMFPGENRMIKMPPFQAWCLFSNPEKVRRPHRDKTDPAAPARFGRLSGWRWQLVARVIVPIGPTQPEPARGDGSSATSTCAPAPAFSVSRSGSG